MSRREIDRHELKLLLKGFKTTPTPTSNIYKLEEDIRKFCRKLGLVEFFADKEDDNDESLMKNKFKFTPKRNRNKCLEQYIDNVSNYPLQPKEFTRNNLTKAEKLALKRLHEDKNIVIKQADKGGAIIIMDTNYYRQ